MTIKHSTFISMISDVPTEEMKNNLKNPYLNNLTNCIISNENIYNDDNHYYFSFDVTCDETEQEFFLINLNS